MNRHRRASSQPLLSNKDDSMLLKCRDCRCGSTSQPNNDFLQPTAPPQHQPAAVSTVSTTLEALTKAEFSKEPEEMMFTLHKLLCWQIRH